MDATGNSVLSTAVLDYNQLLAELGRTAAVTARQTRSRAASEASEGTSPAAAPPPRQSNSNAETRHMSRIPYGRMLRAKDVSRYSATDLSAVLGGAALAAAPAPIAKRAAGAVVAAPSPAVGPGGKSRTRARSPTAAAGEEEPDAEQEARLARRAARREVKARKRARE